MKVGLRDGLNPAFRPARMLLLKNEFEIERSKARGSKLKSVKMSSTTKSGAKHKKTTVCFEKKKCRWKMRI